jgi:hypothetical protein
MTVDVGTTGWEWSSDESALLPNPGPSGCVSDALCVETVGNLVVEAAKKQAGLDFDAPFPGRLVSDSSILKSGSLDVYVQQTFSPEFATGFTSTRYR